MNENLFIENIERYPDSYVQVFTMNGNILFETNAYDNTWDFSKDGVLYPSGNYICVVRVDGFDTVLKQTITLVRN